MIYHYHHLSLVLPGLSLVCNFSICGFGVTTAVRVCSFAGDLGTRFFMFGVKRSPGSDNLFIVLGCFGSKNILLGSVRPY